MPDPDAPLVIVKMTEADLDTLLTAAATGVQYLDVDDDTH